MSHLDPVSSAVRLSKRHDDLPATSRLRAGLLIAPDTESLVDLFAQALEEHGISGHFCLAKAGDVLVPLAGDSPALAGSGDCMTIDTDNALMPGARVLLATPVAFLTREQLARVRGYAQLFAARVIALQELADDVETDCGLTLRERYVLGRRLAGLAPLDIAAEAGLSVATVSQAIDSAVERLRTGTLEEAIAFAARRGWLAVTNLKNCSSSSQKITYKLAQNG